MQGWHLQDDNPLLLKKLLIDLQEEEIGEIRSFYDDLFISGVWQSVGKAFYAKLNLIGSIKMSCKNMYPEIMGSALAWVPIKHHRALTNLLILIGQGISIHDISLDFDWSEPQTG